MRVSLLLTYSSLTRLIEMVHLLYAYKKIYE